MIVSGKKYGGRIAAMVSGGIDSMVMLDLLIRSGSDVFVVHVDHGIREQSRSDSKFVERFCARNGLEFEAYRFDIPSMAKASGRSIETEARQARRNVARGLLSGGRADKVAFAHHADDNAETVLMHILRGSGVDGLVGIRETDEVIRPLLAYTRAEIEEYAALYDIPHVEDSTNSDVRYTRNFIRHEVMPLLRTRYPKAAVALNRLAINAKETLDALDSELDPSMIRSSGDEVVLSLDALETPLAPRYVTRAAKTIMPVDVTRAQIKNVLSLKSSATGSVAELANGVKAYKGYGEIVFGFVRNFDDIVLPFAEGEQRAGSTTIRVRKTDPKVIKGCTVVAGPLPDGCVFRRRCEGDRFTPYGGCEKSLKKFLIDKKIPSRLRNGLVCLCLGSEVLAIVGVEISDKCKITDETSFAYLITQENDFETECSV